jgi:2-haloacid dehalogenase
MLNQFPTVKAIVFDAYGTLLNVAGIDRQIEVCFGHSPSSLIAATWRQKQLEYTWLRSLMVRYRDFYDLTEDALKYALSATNTPYQEEDIRLLMKQYYFLKVYEDVSPTLAQLQSNYQLAILSNANPSLLEKAAVYNGIDHYLSEIISADEVQCYKPSPEVYRLAEQKLALDKKQILFISSNTWDIAGAASYGLKTCWINRKGGVPEQLDYFADVSINQIRELVK